MGLVHLILQKQQVEYQDLLIVSSKTLMFFCIFYERKDHIVLADIDGNDEFAIMTQNMNYQVQKIEKLLKMIKCSKEK